MSRQATNPIRTFPALKPLSGQEQSRERKRERKRRAARGAANSDSHYWVDGYPWLVAEWHPWKNGTLTPDQVSYGSRRQIWWKCPKGVDHEWRARAARRVGGSGCPFCAHQKLSRTNSVAAIAPEIAAEWHPIRNGKLTPDEVIVGSGRKVWWQCSVALDHGWRASPGRRVYEGSGCPHCEGLRVSSSNSLRRNFPSIAAEWHPTKNGELTPLRVAAGSTHKAWWRCAKGRDHVWQAMVRARTRMGEGCPFCTLQKTSVTNRLDTKRPKLAAEWHPTKNGELSARDVTVGSKRKVWWRCATNPEHEWLATVSSRAKQQTGCPYCTGRFLADENTLARARPELAAEWHPTKNGELTPSDVAAGSGARVFWKCAQGPDHEWQSTVSNRTRQNTRCPFCLGRKVSVTNSLAALEAELCREWHPSKNGALTPEHVVAGSKQVAYWQCQVNSRHVWRAPISERRRGRAKCPMCSVRSPASPE